MIVGVFCFLVLIYLGLLARVNIVHFKNSFLNQLERQLISQARGQARITENALVMFVSEMTDAAELLLAAKKNPAQEDILTASLKGPVQGLYVFDKQSLPAATTSDLSGADTTACQAFIKQIGDRPNGVVRLDGTDKSRVWVISEFESKQGFCGYAAAVLLWDDFAKNVLTSGIIHEDTVFVSDPRGHQRNPVVDSSAGIFERAAKGLEGASTIERQAGGNLLVAYSPALLFNECWPVMVVRNDLEIQGIVRTHAEGIFVAMGCLFLVLLIVCGFYYSSEKRRLILEQQTELSRTTSELHYVASEKRQLSDQFSLELTFFRHLINAIPIGLYWKDQKGKLKGQNAVLDGWLKQAANSAACFGLIADEKLDHEVLTKGIDLMHLPQTLKVGGQERNVLISRIGLRGKHGRIEGMLNCQIPVDSFTSLYGRSICSVLDHNCAAEQWNLPIVLISGDLHIQYVNPAFARWMGRQPEDLYAGSACELLEMAQPDLQRILGQGTNDGVWLPLTIRGRQISAFVQKSCGQSGGAVLIVGETLSKANNDRADGKPARPAANSELPASDSPKAPEVLIVDDVEENRTLLEILVTKNSCQSTGCSGGNEAIEQCSRKHFDLILMDIQMPDMDGFEAMKRIRQGRLNQFTPIIAMTASDKREDELAALECGFDDYLSKPINRKMMEQKIWRSLQKVKQIEDARCGREIVSFLDGNPDYRKAIETFVQNLPGRLEDMKAAFESRDLKSLAFKVHALKGIGGFAGFSVYTDKAKTIEESIKEQQLDKIQEQLDELVGMCLRTRLKSDCL